MLQYNLTTKDGLMDAKKVLAPIGIGIGVALLLIRKKIFGSDPDNTKEQAEVAGELLKKGKELGVKNMQITLNGTKGINLKIPIDGVDITTMVGSNNTIIVNAEYK